MKSSTPLPLLLVLGLILSACSSGSGVLGPRDDDDMRDDDDSADDDDATDDDDTVVDCALLEPLPVEFETVTGITSAEDFVFDLKGNVLSIDPQGNLVSSTKEGVTSLVAPGVVTDSAGISMLPDGDVVVADPAAGSLVKIKPNGAVVTLLSGLSYPNGVEIHEDGWIAVSELDAGVVRRVDPSTGEFVILAEGLVAPNGVTFSPDYKRLYVNSFGGGTVHRIGLTEDGSSGEPVLLGEVTGSDVGPPWGNDPWTSSCAGLGVGDACVLIDQPGTCQDWGGGQLACAAPDPFAAACDGLSWGDSCTVLTEAGICQDLGWGMICDDPAWWGTYSGGLDGIAVDGCGNVYVTEYTLGLIWRWTEDGDGPHLVAELPSFWIPNMDFGMGHGGWDADKLWVVDREGDNIYGLDIGVRGRPLAHE